MKDDLARAKKAKEVLENVILYFEGLNEVTTYEPLKTVYMRIIDGVDLLVNIDCEGKACQVVGDDLNGLYEQLDDLEAEITALGMELMLSEQEDSAKD